MKNDKSPEEIAKQFNLEYLGKGKGLLRLTNDTYLHYFNDLQTKSTITVYDLSELEDKITESRKNFNKNNESIF